MFIDSPVIFAFILKHLPTAVIHESYVIYATKAIRFAAGKEVVSAVRGLVKK